MQHSTINIFAEYVDELKRRYKNVIHNIFYDTNELSSIMQNKSCFLSKGNNSVFLLIPRHNSFYELLYTASDRENISIDLREFLASYDLPMDLRASVIGRQQDVEHISEAFSKCGFFIGRKIARMRNYINDKDFEEQIRSLCAGESWNVNFAEPGDARQILDLLISEFDLRSDNLPEINEIEDNIALKQVIAIKDDDCNILACHYFTSAGPFKYGWYDLVKKEFRSRHLYAHIMLFQLERNKKEKRPPRSYSWRDINNKRLMALAKQCNQHPDGVYIYNMCYDVNNNNADLPNA